ncbi:hypothetical protein MBH78_21285 [Oceanimonas sp. NS1]|nr:hypothetical protein [Oceanimonas sp. NS1]
MGIYADHPVYRSIIQHGHNGLLLPMEQQTWADIILQLSKNERERTYMIKNAQMQI